MRTVVLAAAVALAPVLVACGSGSEPGDGDAPAEVAGDPATTGAASPTPEQPGEPSEEVDPAGAKQALRRAVRTVRNEAVTAFDVTASVAGVVAYEVDGVVSGEGWTSTTEFADPRSGGPSEYTMRTIATGGTLWMQMDWTDGRAGCWLTMEPGQVPLGVSAMLPQEPVYLGALANLSVTDFVDEGRTSMWAEVRLSSAAYLFPSEALVGVQIDPRDGEGVRVPLQLGYDGERISGLGIQGADLVTVLDELGSAPTGQARAALEAAIVVVNYPRTEASGEVSAPPASKQFRAPSTGCS